MIPSDEWGSPDWIIAFVEQTWGALDLDVAAQAWNAKARRYFSEHATRRRWRCKHGWNNPPYSRGNLEAFTAHQRQQLLQRHAHSMSGLVPADTSTSWFREQLLKPDGEMKYSEVLVGKHPAPFDQGLLVRSQRLELELLFVGKRVLHQPHPKYRGPLEQARFPSALFHLRRLGA